MVLKHVCCRSVTSPAWSFGVVNSQVWHMQSVRFYSLPPFSHSIFFLCRHFSSRRQVGEELEALVSTFT